MFYTYIQLTYFLHIPSRPTNSRTDSLPTLSKVLRLLRRRTHMGFRFIGCVYIYVWIVVPCWVFRMISDCVYTAGEGTGMPRDTSSIHIARPEKSRGLLGAVRLLVMYPTTQC